MKAFEVSLIEEALSQAEGNQSRAAEILGITERHLRSRLSRLALANVYRKQQDENS